MSQTRACLVCFLRHVALEDDLQQQAGVEDLCLRFDLEQHGPHACLALVKGKCTALRQSMKEFRLCQCFYG